MYWEAQKIKVDIPATLILSAKPSILYILLIQMMKDPGATRKFKMRSQVISQNFSETLNCGWGTKWN